MKKTINERFEQLTAEGLSLTDTYKKICKEYNTTNYQIRKVLTDKVVEHAKNRLTERQKQVYDAIRDGKNQSQIGRDLNLTRQAIFIIKGNLKKKGYL